MSTLIERALQSLARRTGCVLVPDEDHRRALAEHEELQREHQRLRAERDDLLRRAVAAAPERLLGREQLLADGRPDHCYDDPEPVWIESRFVELMRGSDWYRCVSLRKQQFCERNAPRLCRILDNVSHARSRLGVRGPCLDVGSMHGLLFAAIRTSLPQLLPYGCTEYDLDGPFDYEGEAVRCTKFDCERDTLGLDSQSVGVVLFSDVLEHLLVDPVWTLVQLNRVLRTGGHLMISTPNAIASYRFAWRMLRGQSGATENEYKSGYLYDRHNREYSPREVADLMRACGFEPRLYTTHAATVSDPEVTLLAEGRRLGLLQCPAADFGPELYMVGEKVEHVPEPDALPDERRWPAWLYTDAAVYHRRPDPWPILEGPEDAVP